MTKPPGKMGQPVIRVENLAIAYETRYGDVQAVRDVSFEIYRGETLGLVGESGCGKSTVAYGLVNYLGRNGKIARGEIHFQGQSLVGRGAEELRKLRGDQISMVYQDPMTSLNPVLRVGEQMTEVLTVHRGISEAEARERCVTMLKRVYMPDPAKVMQRYPHQISGGQQQRIIIAMALLNNPALLVMDEPTTALDVTVEAAVLDLVADLRRDFDTAILFISHNLGVVARVCDRVGVMYAGELVEMAPVANIFSNPEHPYTQGLIRCLPKLGNSKSSSVLYPIPGRVPAPDNLPPGCVFEPRCDYARDACRQKRPALRPMRAGHVSRCLFSEEINPAEWAPPSDLVFDLKPAALPAANGKPLIRVTGLKTYYPHPNNSPLSLIGLGQKEYVKAVDGVSFEVPPGRTLGVVGESGCGKSTLIKTIIGLEEVTGGQAEFMGFDIVNKVGQRDLSLIQELQMVFQNPDATMNPSYSVGQQIERPLKRFKVVPRNQVRQEVVRLLRAVKLDEHYYNRLPRQLSGGEKQRIGIARAFAGRPDLVLCDEPVSALDVSVQAAVLNLLLEIQKEHGTTMIFIAHDLSVVRFFSDYIAVMYLGQIVEAGPAEPSTRRPTIPTPSRCWRRCPSPTRRWRRSTSGWKAACPARSTRPAAAASTLAAQGAICCPTWARFARRTRRPGRQMVPSTASSATSRWSSCACSSRWCISPR